MATLFEYSSQFNGAYWTVALRMILILIGFGIFGSMLAKKLEKLEFTRESANRWTALVAILVWIVLFSVGMLRHLSFHSKAWDLAIFDQVIWNLANGHGWEASVRNMQDLRGDHFEPILLLFVPIYRILPHIGWLLGIQAAALIGSGLIIRATYREKIGEIPAFLLFLGFCFYPAIHWLVLADFHPIALAPFFIALGWMGSRRNNILLLLIGMIGLGLCGEEGLIVGGWWGLWEFLSRKAWSGTIEGRINKERIPGWAGLAAMVIFWAGFVYLLMVYIPAHRVEREGYFYVHRYEYLGDTIGEIGRNFLLKPWLWIRHAFDARGIALLLLYLVPLGFLPLRRPGILWLLLPTALYTLLSVSDEQRSIFHQYTAVWILFLMIACAEAIMIYMTTAAWTMDVRANPKLHQLKLTSRLVIGSFLGFLAFSPIFGWSMQPNLLTPEPWASEAKGIIQTIGPEDAVAAPSALCPHLSHRRILLLKPNTEWAGLESDQELIILPDFPPH